MLKYLYNDFLICYIQVEKHQQEMYKFLILHKYPKRIKNEMFLYLNRSFNTNFK